MADSIQLLPDNIANQIAAGEVIQRPASAVKELLENAVDAGATEIKLIINDAGKALIQVMDNGKGMSETDARMSFERHATSKIKSIDDLFHIRTMGFRGEALASIAAVAQVELRTRRPEDELGTCISIENSLVVSQEPVAAPLGTSISMKNLFFNVPARRNFLKSNPSEMRHVIDEFIRVALSFPQIFFLLTSNGQQLFYLDAGSLKQRVLQVLGANYNAKLVAVKENTDYLNIYGFVGKPETAKKTRGDQYLFVNNRFIKSPYLNHAIMSAYQDMIAADSFPMYALFIDLDPAQIDINVHPTKQEIKFEDEKIVYAFVQAAVKHALAQFSITPTLDFELDASIQHLDSVQKPFTDEAQSNARASSLFQTFTEANQAHKIERTDDSGQANNDRGPSSFKSLASYFTPVPDQTPLPQAVANPAIPSEPEMLSSVVEQLPADLHPVQLFNTYLLLPKAHSFLLIHQQSAHERIIYERLLQAIQGKAIATQSSLFPVTLEPAPADAALLTELLPDLQKMGYTITPFGRTAFVIQGTPADMGSGNEKEALERIVEQYKHFSNELKLPRREMLLRTVAWQQAVKPGTALSEQEMQSIIADLFACSQPNISPTGKPSYIELDKLSIERMFIR